MSRAPYTTAVVNQLGIDLAKVEAPNGNLRKLAEQTATPYTDALRTIGLADSSGYEWAVQGYVKDVSPALVELQDEDGRCFAYFTHLVRTIDGKPFEPPPDA